MLKLNSSPVISLIWFTLIILKYPLWPLSGIGNIPRHRAALTASSHATLTLNFYTIELSALYTTTCSWSPISIWFMASGHCLDLLFLIISVVFIVLAKSTISAVVKFQTFTHSPPGIYHISYPPQPQSVTALQLCSANCSDDKSELLS